jgi:hypothetical protein
MSFINWGHESPEQKLARKRFEEDQAIFEQRAAAVSAAAAAAAGGGGNLKKAKATLRHVYTQLSADIYGLVGTSTGYVKVTDWNGTVEILGLGNPFTNPNAEGWQIMFGRSNNTDPESSREITIVSCDENGKESGSIKFLQASSCGYLDYDQIEVSGLKDLEYLYCACNIPLSSIDVRGLSKLKALEVNGAKDGTSLLSSLNIEGCVDLTEVYCQQTSLTISQVDEILQKLASYGKRAGTFFANNRSSASDEAVSQLEANGWDINCGLAKD